MEINIVLVRGNICLIVLDREFFNARAVSVGPNTAPFSAERSIGKAEAGRLEGYIITNFLQTANAN